MLFTLAAVSFFCFSSLWCFLLFEFAVEFLSCFSVLLCFSSKFALEFLLFGKVNPEEPKHHSDKTHAPHKQNQHTRNNLISHAAFRMLCVQVVMRMAVRTAQSQ